MHQDLLARLNEVSSQVAEAPSAELRFQASVGLLCDLNMDSSGDGIAEAIDQAMDCVGRGSVEAIGVEHLKPEDCAAFDPEPHFPNESLVRLALEIAVDRDLQPRVQALQCAVSLLARRCENAEEAARWFLRAGAECQHLH